MKKIIFFLALITVGSIQAQRMLETTVNLSNNQDIFLEFKFADDIKVEQWNKNEVQIKVEVTIDNGEGNDYYSLKTEESSGTVEIRSDFGDYFKMKQKQDKNYWNDRHTITDINYTVYLPKNATLKIKSISGSVAANSYSGFLKTDLISGDVTVKNYEGEMHLKTISGDLDVTFRNANVSAKTLTGTIYANLEVEMDEGANRSGGHNKVQGKINNGGKLVKMETISGDIFLRKG